MDLFVDLFVDLFDQLMILTLKPKQENIAQVNIFFIILITYFIWLSHL